MNEKNRCHVAVHADQDVAFWEFVLPSNVTTCEEQAEEMVDRCETLFGTFEDFIVPTEINYHVNLFPADQQLPVTMSDDEHVETIGRELRNASGITATDFRESTRVEVSESRWIPRVGFDGTEVTVQLSDGTVAVSRRNRTVEYRSGEPAENEPTRDPLELTVLHSPKTARFDIDAEYVTTIVVSPLSDIWFEDTEIGSVNRRSLASFLERIEDAFSVATIERTSEWVPVEDFEAIY